MIVWAPSVSPSTAACESVPFATRLPSESRTARWKGLRRPTRLMAARAGMASGTPATAPVPRARAEAPWTPRFSTDSGSPTMLVNASPASNAAPVPAPRARAPTAAGAPTIGAATAPAAPAATVGAKITLCLPRIPATKLLARSTPPGAPSWMSSTR